METESNKISGLLITRNEKDNIQEVIKNLDFVDEIIVVDSYSTDGTFEIVQSLKHVRLFQNKFINFANQRNFAIQQAKNPWIFFIDADERVTADLKKEILEHVNSPENHVAFKIRRLFYFGKRPIRFSGLQTDKVTRLFKKGKALYISDRWVHEQLDIQGKIKELHNPMLHYSAKDFESYKHKAEHYAELKAKELFEKNSKPNFIHYYLKPIYKFMYNYLFRLGFLDGKSGFMICYLNAYSVYRRYQILKSMN